MLNVIDASRRPNVTGILKDLRGLPSVDISDLVNQFPWLNWKRLNHLYNPSKHVPGAFSRAETEEMYSLCRRFLSSLVGSGGSK